MFNLVVSHHLHSQLQKVDPSEVIPTSIIEEIAFIGEKNRLQCFTIKRQADEPVILGCHSITVLSESLIFLVKVSIIISCAFSSIVGWIVHTCIYVCIYIHVFHSNNAISSRCDISLSIYANSGGGVVWRAWEEVRAQTTPTLAAL